MDIGTLSLILLIGMLVLLAIGMPLGFASGFLAVVVLFLKFGPDLLLSGRSRWPPAGMFPPVLLARFGSPCRLGSEACRAPAC